MASVSLPWLPVSPDEVRKKQRATIEELVSDVISTVNNQLLSTYPDADGVVCIAISTKDEVVRKEVLKAYELVGWDVKYVPDQRDGDYYTFKKRGT